MSLPAQTSDQRRHASVYFPDRLEQLARQRPDAIALRYRHRGGWRFRCWAEMAAHVQAARAGLHALGFGSGDRLFILGDLDPHLLTMSFAAWSLKGAVVAGQSLQNTADMLDELGHNYVFIQGRRALLAWLQGWAGAGIVPRMSLIYDQSASGRRDIGSAGDGLSSCRLLTYAALIGDCPIRASLPAMSRSPADIYWVEESSNDPGKCEALVDFWLTNRVALTFPAAQGKSVSPQLSLDSGSVTCRPLPKPLFG